jgi:DNA-binding CsgD family transcriptional regulator
VKTPRTVCRAGLHDLTLPGAVTLAEWPSRPGATVRMCVECSRIRNRRRKRHPKQSVHTNGGRPPQYNLSANDVRTLQMTADGLTLQEIAVRECVTLGSLKSRMYHINRRLGVGSQPAAVAQGLKRGIITPDKATAKRLRKRFAQERKSVLFRVFRKELKEVIQGAMPTRATARSVIDSLAAIEALTQAHAVSIYWALGEITSVHVPQTRNRYKGRDQSGRFK